MQLESLVFLQPLNDESSGAFQKPIWHFGNNLCSQCDPRASHCENSVLSYTHFSQHLSKTHHNETSPSQSPLNESVASAFWLQLQCLGLFNDMLMACLYYLSAAQTTLNTLRLINPGIHKNTHLEGKCLNQVLPTTLEQDRHTLKALLQDVFPKIEMIAGALRSVYSCFTFKADDCCYILDISSNADKLLKI